MSYLIEPIATIRTPFSEKFGIPRQPGLVPAAKGVIEFLSPYADPALLDGIEQSSHLWLQFLFHQSPQDWSSKVRPPRLGGNKKMGVLATRSPNRPNRLGLSLVKFERTDLKPLTLTVSGVDLLDGTPILDIKPFLPYAEKPSDAFHTMASEEPPRISVEFSQQAEQQCREIVSAERPEFTTLVHQVLSQDPRPAYHNDQRVYGMTLWEYNVRWQVSNSKASVLSVIKKATGS